MTTTLSGKTLYRNLQHQLMEAGCFKPTPWRQSAGMIAVLATFGLGYGILLHEPNLAVRLAALLLIATTSVHAGFIGHEAGHNTITKNRALNTAIGQIFMTLLTGLAYGHFQDIHRRHHPHCNDPSRDPDMQSGAFSLYLESAWTKRGLADWVTRHQSWLIWILISLQGFTLKIDSLRFMCREPRRAAADWAVMPLHAALWLGLPMMILGPGAAILNYAVLTWMIGPYLGSVFLVNHIGTRVIGPDENFSHFHHEIATTRNLGSSRLTDFLFGGLNNHIEHHLFPNIPKARLRRARQITREFCRDCGIAYREQSWLKACAEVSRYMGDVARSARGVAAALVIAALVTPALGGCSFAIYSAEIDATDLSTIQPGASREQVEDVLGDAVAEEAVNGGVKATYQYDQGAPMAHVDPQLVRDYLGLYGPFWEPILMPVALVKRAERVSRQKGSISVTFGADGKVIAVQQGGIAGDV